MARSKLSVTQAEWKVHWAITLVKKHRFTLLFLIAGSVWVWMLRFLDYLLQYILSFIKGKINKGNSSLYCIIDVKASDTVSVLHSFCTKRSLSLRTWTHNLRGCAVFWTLCDKQGLCLNDLNAVWYQHAGSNDFSTALSQRCLSDLGTAPNRELTRDKERSETEEEAGKRAH